METYERVEGPFLFRRATKGPAGRERGLSLTFADKSPLIRAHFKHCRTIYPARPELECVLCPGLAFVGVRMCGQTCVLCVEIVERHWHVVRVRYRRGTCLNIYYFY